MIKKFYSKLDLNLKYHNLNKNFDRLKDCSLSSGPYCQKLNNKSLNEKIIRTPENNNLRHNFYL